MAQNDLERDSLETTSARKAVTGSEISDTNQMLYRLGFLGRVQHTRCIEEEMYGPEQLAPPNAEPYDHSICLGERGCRIALV